MSALHSWNDTKITSEDQALQVLTELRGKRWLSRVLSKSYGGLVPSIDREPPNWFMCVFYPPAFPRQHAQQGVYTLTARFGRDHADAIADLFNDKSQHHRYVISATLKPDLRKLLRERHGIWRGSLFPDAAGAADTARVLFG
jgi:hypothetical protein